MRLVNLVRACPRTALIGLAAVLVLPPVPLQAQGGAPAMTVIVVRHAEKGTEPANDPPLTDAGTARAKALAAALANAKVGVVITTQLLRTRDTGRPTAEAAKAPMEVVPTGGAAAVHAKAVADAVKKHSGKTVLVVGHSNTVNHIVAALGGPTFGDLCDSEYSNLYTLVIDAGGTRFMKSTFGAPSPEVATGCPVMK
ncbi:MAG: histidine phosphatase family protein [Gemmatimonadetes bacterium]|nr:histidine phosphatase family protein [Gemmatimonadota bacterium]